MRRINKLIGNTDGPAEPSKLLSHKEMKKYGADGFRSAPINVLLRLPDETLYNLPAEVIERIPQESLRVMPKEVLAKLSPETLSQLGPETLGRLPTECLQQLHPKVLAGLPLGHLSKLPPPTLGAVLPYLDMKTLMLFSRHTFAKVDGLALVRIRADYLNCLSNDVLSDLYNRLPREIFVQLSPIVLQRYPQSFFENIPIEAWQKLSLEGISNLPPQARDAMPAELHVQPGRIGSPTERVPLERTASDSTSTSTYQRPAIPALDAQQLPPPPPPPPPSLSAPNGNGILVPARSMPGPFSRQPPRAQAGSDQSRDRPPLSSENLTLNGKPSRRSTSQPPVARSRPPSSASIPPNDGPGWSKAALATFASRSAAERPGVERKDSHDARDPPPPTRHALPKTPDSEHSSDQDRDPWPAVSGPGHGSKHDDPQAPVDSNLNSQGQQDRWIGKLNEDFINLSIAHKSIVERLFKYMEKNQPKNVYDRNKDDPVELITSYCEEALDSAQHNFKLINETFEQHKQLQIDYENEKRGGEALQLKLETEQQRIRYLEDKVGQLEGEIKEYKGDLIRASGREADYQTAAASQQNEISRLQNVNADLDKRLEKATKKVETTLLNQQSAINTHTATLRGQIQNLETQLTTQRNEYGNKIETHRIYYQGEIDKKQALLEQQDADRQYDVEQLNAAHEASLTSQAQDHQFELEQLDATHRAQLHKQAQDHQLALGQIDSAHQDQLEKHGQAYELVIREKDTELQDLQARYTADTQALQARYDTDTQALQAKYTTDMQALQTQHAEHIKKQRAMYEEQSQRERADYEAQFAHKQAAHEKELRKLTKAHDDNVVHLRERVASLENDLVDNSDDFRPASDDTLRLKYRDLKKWVETITEPFNLGVTNVALSGGRLDPTRFLEREGKNQLRFLLRSVVWARIMEGFFSAPFGFGALGSGGGRAMLMGLYMAWRRLFGLDSGLAGAAPAASSGHAPDESFRLFQTDKEANRWRSATFQSIMMAVMPKNHKKGAAGTPSNTVIVQPYLDNRQKVHDQILLDLAEVCSSGVSSDIEEKVVDIVRLAGELALEFGSQRAGLGLHMPARGEGVKIGPEFVDCVDDDEARGVVEEVDLVVSPKLFRVGDGRNDLKVWKIIFPGEIYPRRS
ncbi:hypothetical protein B0T22DRAFT_483199 [Podospora appendiculata]|uniref:Uncharacterized protein n=1 Tax=Podospora appendiculata TaxID=314037 RepID=A0AAE0X267_9PEZI|nr:hypothetical protein B0T22DRAFT_483199 [Podospora appendiculata]